MDMTGEYRIPAPRQRVWEALNDPLILRQSIPGCQSLEKVSENELTAKVKAKVGPVAATFNGKVTLGDLNPPESYTISGEGSGGVAGFAKGGANVHLTEDGPDTTILRYDAKADVGGKLAQIGSRLVQGTAKKMADDFFGKFSEIVGGAAAAPAAPAPAAPAAPAPAAAAAPAAPQPSPAMAAPEGAMPTPPPTAPAQPPMRPAPEEPQPRPLPPEAPGAAPAGGLANNPLVWIGAILLIVLVLFLIMA